MTNEEALKRMKWTKGRTGITSEEAEAIGYAIEKLSNSDEDCISRAEAIKAIRNYNVTIEVSRAIGKSQLADIVDSINKVQEKMISELPSIQPKPKIQMVQNPCVECGCNYCTNDDCENRYIVDIAESEDKE